MPALFDTGMFVRTPAWHGEGNLVQEWPGSWKEASRLAGIDWDIEVHEVAVKRGEEWHPSPEYKALLRSDNKAVLSIAGENYAPIYNADFGELIEVVMSGATGKQPLFDALVSLRGGRVIAATMITDVAEVPGDPSPLAMYAVFFTSHDGSYATRCGQTTVRVVCANTLGMADADFNRTKADFKFKHTAGWKDRIEDVKEGMTRILDSHKYYLDMATDLAGQQVSREQVTEFVDKWIPYSTDMSARQMTNVMKDRATFWDLYEGELGAQTLEGIRGTKWGVLQAAVEMKDHFSRFHSQDTLINRVLLHGDADKPHALRILAKI